MKKLFVILALLALPAICAPAQVTLPLNGIPASEHKQPKPTSKTVSGTVTDKADKPIAGAVVYLKNSKTLAVKSIFTSDAGSYRIPQVALNTDYEVWAEKDGKKSDIKTVSQFDDRFTPTINLRINLDK